MLYRYLPAKQNVIAPPPIQYTPADSGIGPINSPNQWYISRSQQSNDLRYIATQWHLSEPNNSRVTSKTRVYDLNTMSFTDGAGTTTGTFSTNYRDFAWDGNSRLYDHLTLNSTDGGGALRSSLRWTTNNAWATNPVSNVASVPFNEFETVMPRNGPSGSNYSFRMRRPAPTSSKLNSTLDILYSNGTTAVAFSDPAINHPIFQYIPFDIAFLSPTRAVISSKGEGYLLDTSSIPYTKISYIGYVGTRIVAISPDRILGGSYVPTGDTLYYWEVTDTGSTRLPVNGMPEASQVGGGEQLLQTTVCYGIGSNKDHVYVSGYVHRREGIWKVSRNSCDIVKTSSPVVPHVPYLEHSGSSFYPMTDGRMFHPSIIVDFPAIF